MEHTIVLGLDSKLDKIIYDNLMFSSYFCTLLNPKQARCSQFKQEEALVTTFKTNELYSYKSASGSALRVYKTKEGAAHLEFQEHESSTLHRYTFTSVKRASDFAAENEKLFKTENFDWDISYLDYIL